MADKSIFEQAEENAARYSKPPAHDPVHAGIVCAFITSIILVVFCGVAGIDTERVTQAIMITCTLAFAAPYFYFRREQRRHWEAISRELEQLRMDAPNQSP